MAAYGNNGCSTAFHFAGKALKKSPHFRNKLKQLGFDFKDFCCE